MVEIAEYEQRGDLDAPFELTKKAERAQADAERIRDAVGCDAPTLTWEEYVAGKPCSGCGRPYRDDEHWESKGIMHFTDEERARHEAEEARYQQDHRDCGSHRHSVSGSLTMHCGKCCPAPTLSPEQRDSIGKFLGTWRPPQQLMNWRLRLYCGDVVERVAHYTHKTLRAAFTGHVPCPECGLDPAVIVDGQAVGLLEQPARAQTGRSAGEPTRSRKPTKAELEVREFEAEVARLRKG